MIRSILKIVVFGALTGAHAAAVADEFKKPKEKRSKTQIVASTAIGSLGVLAIVGVINNELNK